MCDLDIQKVAIEDIVAETNSKEKADVIAQTALSKFESSYNLDKPDCVVALTDSTILLLRSLQDKGFDMRHYADRMASFAARIYDSFIEKYCADHPDDQQINQEPINLRYETTIKVIDKAIHKSGTRKFVKEF